MSGVGLLGLCPHDPLIADCVLAETVAVCWTQTSGLFSVVLRSEGDTLRRCSKTKYPALEGDHQVSTIFNLLEMMLEEFPPPPFGDPWWESEARQIQEIVARLREAEGRAPLTYSRVLLIASKVREESEHSAIIKVVGEP